MERNIPGKHPISVFSFFHTSIHWLTLGLLLSRTDIDQFSLFPSISYPTGEHARLRGTGKHWRRYAGSIVLLAESKAVGRQWTKDSMERIGMS